MPKISVILTTYNRPKKLRRAIKSVLKQTFKDFELIIVDDHSNDGKTQKVCQRYTNKDSRVRYIRLQSNFGQHTYPKNQGIKSAKSDYIAYLDDDNEYRKDHLQALWKYKENLDIVYGDRWLIDETGRGKNCMGISSNFDARRLQFQNYIDTSDVLMKKSVLTEIGGWDESLPKFADWNLWVRCAKAGYKIARIPFILTDYYVHKGCNQFKSSSGIDPVTGLPKPTFEPDACKIYPDKTSIGVRPKKKVAVFTLTMNRLEYTKRMFGSMTRMAGYDFDWFVVDNGSKDETAHWLEGKCTLIKNKENVGISKASNQALEAIGDKYDIIVKADNDCEFMSSNWLAEIVDLQERQTRVVVSPRVEGLRDSPGGVPRDKFYYIGKHFMGNVPHIGGICVAAPAVLYKNFRWEEDDYLHGDQDYVFSQYALSEKYILSYMENSIVEHIDSTGGQEKKYPEYFKKRPELKTTRYEHKHS